MPVDSESPDVPKVPSRSFACDQHPSPLSSAKKRQECTLLQPDQLEVHFVGFDSILLEVFVPISVE